MVGLRCHSVPLDSSCVVVLPWTSSPVDYQAPSCREAGAEVSGREAMATASGLIGSGPELPASVQKENVPDKPGIAQPGSLCPRKTPGPTDCPPRPGIHGTEQRDLMSCSLNGSDSTWKKDPSSQRFSTLQSSLLALPSSFVTDHSPTVQWYQGP